MPTASQHESAAVSILAEVEAGIKEARHHAEHGGYAAAFKAVRAARDRLYFAEVELQKAGMAAKRGDRP